MDTPQPVMQSNRFTMELVRKFISNHWRDYTILFSIGGLIIGLDQWTKALVRNDIPLGSDWLPSWMSWLMPYARIRHWYNSGAAFGFFQSGNLIFTVLAIIVSIVIIYYFPRVSRRDWWLRLAMGIQFGGAIGNLIDRVVFKQVTDFISLGSFAVFNVADASITVGVIILVLGAWIADRAAKKHPAAAVSGKGEGSDEISEEDKVQGSDEAKGD
jgi:signal peptidase II